jgi:hypothetical protein
MVASMRMGARIAAAAVLAGVGVCSGLLGQASGAGAVPARVLPLLVVETKVPPLPVAHYVTSGTYPQFASADVSLGRVNKTLRDAVLADQASYTPLARRALPPVRGWTGVYSVAPTPSLMSASTVAVSVLLPDTELYPGGNDGAGWISATARVPSGSLVGLSDLFARPGLALDALAAASRQNGCIAVALHYPGLGASVAPWLKPTMSNYRYFALTPRGLAVGFEQDTVASPPCGRVEVTVPYSVLRPYLSSLGVTLIAAVRRPRSR